MLKLTGIIVAAAICVMVLWLLVERAAYRWGGIAALIVAFAIIGLVVYLADRRKIKEAENLMAERSGMG